jgi:hypothetical protein
MRKRGVEAEGPDATDDHIARTSISSSNHNAGRSATAEAVRYCNESEETAPDYALHIPC